LHERPHIDRANLAAFAASIALVCIVILTMEIRDRWHSPEIKPTTLAEHTTTGQAARDAGAMMTPTDPKLLVEPALAGPKQAQPANPN
jgi:hypothetical protein